MSSEFLALIHTLDNQPRRACCNMLFHATVRHTYQSELQIIPCHHGRPDACFEIAVCHRWSDSVASLGV